MWLMCAVLAIQNDEAPTRSQKLAEIRKVLNSNDGAARLTAVAELGLMYDDESRALLIPLLSNSNEAIRRAAVDSIGKHRHSSVIQAISGFIDRDNHGKSSPYLDALANTGMCAANAVLIPLLESKSEDMVVHAANAILKIGDPDVAPGLIAIFKRAEAKRTDKNSKTGKLHGKLLQALRDMTGESITTSKDWEKFLKTWTLEKPANVYFCPASGQSYDVNAPGDKKCPKPDVLKGHLDVYLRHKRGTEMVGAPPKR